MQLKVCGRRRSGLEVEQGGENQGVKKPQLAQQHPQVVAGTAQHCVDRTAQRTLEPIAIELAIGLHVADGRLVLKSVNYATGWRCHVSGVCSQEGERDLPVSCGRGILGDLGQFTPRREACGEVFAIRRSAQQMPLKGEVLADQPEALEESLSARRVAKPSHASLAFAGRLMAVLGAVVHAGSGLHEHVLDVGERRDVSLGSRVAA